MFGIEAKPQDGLAKPHRETFNHCTAMPWPKLVNATVPFILPKCKLSFYQNANSNFI